VTELAPWLAVLMLGAAFAAALGALLARALFVMSMYLVASGALAASAFALLGQASAALVVALLFAGLGPVMMLGLVLLSARTTKAQRRARPWLSVSAAIAVGVVVLWATPDLRPALPREVEADAVGAWIAPLIFVAIGAFIALLGYGERGALQRAPMDGDA